MAEKRGAARYALLGAVLGLSLLGTGCFAPRAHMLPPAHNLPRELMMTSHPPHLIEPGDSLVMAMRSLPLPRPPYRLRELDQVTITIEGGIPLEPIAEQIFVVEPEGIIRLGGSYGSIRVLGMSLDEAGKAIDEMLKKPPPNLAMPRTLVTLYQGREMDPVPDTALVRPDGTISLGSYGYIHIAGMTEQQARVAIEEHLAEFLIKPEINVEVAVENYKSFYLVVQRPTGEETVIKLPLSGREHVLDIISATADGGLPIGSNKHRMWIARPAPADADCDQVLPIMWSDIVMRGRTSTNYQLLPGDRLYIAVDPWIKAEQLIAKVTAPIERLGAFAQSMLSIEEQFRLAITSQNGLFGSGFFGFGGFPGFAGF